MAVRVYNIPEDMEFVGRPCWTVEEARHTLGLIEQAQEADLADYPGSSHAHLVEAVLRGARYARQRLESGDMTAEEAGAEIETLTARICEIRRRAAEPDRARGAKVRAGYELAGEMARNKRRIPADEIAGMLADRKRGLTIGQIARKRGLTYNQAKKRLQRANKMGP